MIPPTDTVLANLAAQLYAGPQGFDHIIQVNANAPYVGIRHLEDFDLIGCRGSKTIPDWFRDGLSEVARVVPAHLHLGLIPFGFGAYVTETYTSAAPFLDPRIPLVAFAHSLGCPEVLYQVGAHLAAGGTVAKIALFEPPNAGTATLTKLFASIDIHSYLNGADPVPHLPVPIPDILPWEQPRAFRLIDVPPTVHDPIADIPGLEGAGYHNIALVTQGVAAYEAAHP